MTPLTYLTAWAFIACVCSFVVVPLLIVAGEFVGRRRARKAASDAEETARVMAAFDALRAMPETTAFDPPVDLARARLHSVPLNVVALPLPPADESWLDELIDRPDPFTVPGQRKPGGES